LIGQPAIDRDRHCLGQQKDRERPAEKVKPAEIVGIAVATIEPSVAVRTVAIIAAASTGPGEDLGPATTRSLVEGRSAKALRIPALMGENLA
jgi:hypothetical protein